MNKILTTALVAVLGIAGLSGYIFMNPDKNFSEYVPAPITSMVGNYLPRQLTVEPVMTPFTTETDEPKPSENTVAIKEPTQVKLPQEVKKHNITAKDACKIAANDENAVEIAMCEIQKSINEVSDPIPSLMVSDNPKAKKIAKKIDEASFKISKLAVENKKLETKFQNILRKNRELAKKLQAIDQQLVSGN